MKESLLIHSMAEFSSITLPILDAIHAKKVVEIGAEYGGNSKVLYDWLSKNDGKLISIDPNPNDEFTTWLTSVAPVVTHLAAPSLETLSTLKQVDAWFIDGDHNWYTVYHELQLIRKNAREEHKPMLVFLHDVSWPCARRDHYYDPDRIPENFRHAYSYDHGTHLEHQELIKGGFRSQGHFAISTQFGGERNGVLTAVEDFLKEYSHEFCYANIPAIFGLGVVFDRNHPQVEQIAAILAPLHQHPLLATLEENRLLNYLKVIEWQDKENADEAIA